MNFVGCHKSWAKIWTDSPVIAYVTTFSFLYLD